MVRFLVLFALIVTTSRAQSQTIDCMAADHATQWPTHFGSGTGPKYVPAPQTLVSLLSGSYDVDIVTTEGVHAPTVSRWRIAVASVDTLLWPPSRFGFLSGRPLFVGTRTDVLKPTPLDSLRQARFLGGLSDFVMAVDSSTGNLRWQTDPGVLDSGRFFSVAEVDSTGFYGRWVDGGIVMVTLRRDTLTVGEQQRGYYCARRLR